MTGLEIIGLVLLILILGIPALILAIIIVSLVIMLIALIASVIWAVIVMMAEWIKTLLGFGGKKNARPKKNKKNKR